MQLAVPGASQAASIPYPPSLGPAVAVDVGYRDFSYGSGTLATPTGEKPQSKLWWNDGVWWGVLWDAAIATHRIYRFDAVAHSWTNVGPSADNRSNTLVDVLWDGTRLYVASHIFDSSGEFRLHSYTYDTATDTYSLRSGFPVVMGSGSAEALTIAKDTTGKLWITWEESSDIMVNRSTSAETAWGAAFRLPTQGNDCSSDDISSVIAFGTRIGILWSNQSDDRMYFSTHIDGNADTTWQAREDALVDAVLGEVADDHLSLALSFTTNPPTLFAATKTSLSGAATLPQIYLLKRDPSGVWAHYVVGDQDDDHTRAIVQVDDENRDIYVVARCDAGDDAIRMKVADMDNISFVDGVGTALIEGSANRALNNPTGTKQTLNGTMNLLVLASDETSRFYFHNTVDLATATPTPDISVTPTSHPYGNILVGSSSSRTFVVRNDGTGSLQVTSTSLNGSNPTSFAITGGGGPFTLAAGATRNVVVAFNPTSAGARSATLRFANNDPNENPFDVALTGTGIQPDIALSPASHAYGNVLVGASASQTFVVQNTGSSALNVSATALTGTHAALFSITSGGGAFSLAAGATRNVVVAFNPTSTGAKSAALRFTSDDPDENPLDAALSGTGVQPDIALSPASHAYGNVLVGASASQTFVVQNTGNNTLQVASTEIIGPDSSFFSITSGSGAFSLTAGATHDVVIAFNPTSTGAKSAALRFTSDDPDENPLDAALTGTGVQPDIALSPASHAYGNVLVGASASLTFVVQNTGNSTLLVAATEIIGADAGFFSITSGSGAFSLAAGATQDVVIAFSPSSPGARSATLRLASDDPDENPLDAALNGTGTQPDVAVSPPSHAFGDIGVGESASRDFIVHNLGTGILDVTGTSLSGANAADFAIASGSGPFSLAAGDSHTVTVSFAPIVPGAKAATLHLATNDPDEGALEVGLTGTAVQQDIAIDSSAHDFGSVLLGSSAGHTFVVRNTGTALLSVSSSSLLGVDSASFSIASGGGAFALAPLDSHEVRVAFAPGATGAQVASLRFTSDDPDENPLDVSLTGAGVQQDIEVSATAHDYGNVLVGATSGHTFVVRNTGTANLDVSTVSLLGADASDFALTNGGDGFILAPLDSHLVVVDFAPATLGAKAATLRLVSDDSDENPLDLTLAGAGVLPEIAVDPSSHDFGTVLLGASAEQEFMVRNEGTAVLGVTAASVLGADAADFVLASGGGAIAIAPGDSHAVVIRFEPSSLGSKSAALRLANDDLDEGILDVMLAGTAIEPDIAVVPSHDFGAVAVGDSVLHGIKVKNVGTAPLQVTSTTLNGKDANEFTVVSGGAPFTIAPGDSQTVVLRFDPANIGDKTARLRIVSDDPDESTINVQLTGNGTLPEPDIAVLPVAQDYGTVALGLDASHTFVVRNTGDVILNVASTSLTGPDAADFAILSGGGIFALAPGDSTEVDVRFTPAAIGARSATLRIQSDDPDENPLDIAMAGTGIVLQPELAVAPTEHDFGSVTLGTSVDNAFVLRNIGNVALDVTSIGLLGAEATDFALLSGGDPIVLAPGDSSVAVVRCSPMALGVRAATLRFESNDPAHSPLDVALFALGVEPDIVVSPLDHNFATLAVGDSASAAFVVRNAGVGELLVTGTIIVGPDAGDFALVTAAPFAVAAGDSADLLVRYVPSTPGSKLATLRIESTDADGDTISVLLTGAAVASFQPDLDAAASFVLGQVAVGASDSVAIGIGNLGLSDLHVTSMAIVGPDSLDFILTPVDVPFTVAPHETSMALVAFSPGSLGSKSATLRLESDDPDENPWDITLQGTGGAPDLALTPLAYDFGGIQVGTSALQAFVATNDGSLVLHVTATSLAGTSASEFDITSGGGAFSLAPGGTRNIVVQLAPAVTGPKSATLVLASDDPDAPSTNVSLSGSGMPGPAGGGDTVLLEQTASGGSSNSLTVTTASTVTAATENVFLAAVSAREHIEVASVDGMGLTWTRVRMQCGARATKGIEVWWGQGIPVDGAVSATFTTPPEQAAILVARYSGADLDLPLANASSANTLGLAGDCSGGTDSDDYAIDFGTGADGAVVFAAVAIGARVLTPGPGWVQRDLVQVVSANDTCGVALLDRTVPMAGSVVLDGNFDQPTDWALIAIEIRPQGGSTTDADHDPWSAVVDEPSVRVWQAAGRGAATVAVAVPRATIAQLTLYDVRGHLVQRIWRGPLAAGRHRLEWAEDPRDRRLPSGIYFVRADLGGHVLTRKLLFVH